jgi:hypothetical protein
MIAQAFGATMRDDELHAVGESRRSTAAAKGMTAVWFTWLKFSFYHIECLDTSSNV